MATREQRLGEMNRIVDCVHQNGALPRGITYSYLGKTAISSHDNPHRVKTMHQEPDESHVAALKDLVARVHSQNPGLAQTLIPHLEGKFPHAKGKLVPKA